MRQKLAKAFVVVTLLVLCSPAVAYANQDLGREVADVVFVFDNSYFMRYADPNPNREGYANFAAVAANIFVEMSRMYDRPLIDDFRFAYVMYRDAVINSRGSLVEVHSPPHLIALQESLASMEYDGYSDVFYGVLEALGVFPVHGAEKRAIILITSLDIRVPEGHSRTQEEVESALGYVATRAQGMGIPIHIIGARVDHEDFVSSGHVFENLANSTGGRFIMADTPAGIASAMWELFGDISGAETMETRVFPVTGAEQVYTHSVPHQSVPLTMITLISEMGMTFSSITHVAGFSPDDITRSPENLETQEPFAIYAMQGSHMGEWNIRFGGFDNDTITIGILSFYDIAIALDSAGRVHEAGFSWRAVTGAGVTINDPTIFDAFAPTIHVRNIQTNNVYTFAFTPGMPELTVNLEVGEYEAYISLLLGGELMVSPISGPFTVWDVETERDVVLQENVSVVLWTVLPFFDTREMPLSEIVATRGENRPHSIDIRGEGFEYIVLIEFFDASGSYFTLSAVGFGGFGRHSILVVVSDAFGREARFHFDVMVLSGWFVVGGVSAFVLILFLLILRSIASSKPFLNDPMERFFIKMSIPLSFDLDSPPEAAITLPRVKGKKTLRDVISLNVSVSRAYQAAFDHISWFYDNTTLYAKSKYLLEIKPPANPAYIVRVDGMELPEAIIAKNGAAVFRLGFYNHNGAYDEYVIEFVAG